MTEDPDMPEITDTEAIDYQLKRTYPNYSTKDWLTSPFPYITAIRELLKKKKKKKATLREAHDTTKK
jgi:hypothetical protein